MYVDANYVLKASARPLIRQSGEQTEFRGQSKEATVKTNLLLHPCQAEFSYDYPKEPPKHLREITLPTLLLLELPGFTTWD